MEKKVDQVGKAIVGKQKTWYQSIVGNEDDKIIRDVAIFTGSFVLGFGVGVISGN